MLDRFRRDRRDQNAHDDPTQRIPIADWPAPARPDRAPTDYPVPPGDHPAAVARGGGARAWPAADPAVVGGPDDHPARRRARRILRAQRIIGYFTGLIQGLLLIRFVFLLVGANSTTPVVAFVDRVTRPLTLIFEGIFPTLRAGDAVLDFSILFAVIFYAILGLILKRLARLWG